MASHGSETRSRTKRKPFSDLTNAPSSSTSTSTRSHSLLEPNAKSNQQAESSNPNPNPSPNPTSSSCSTPRAKGLRSSDSDFDEVVVSTTYTRRTTVKRKSTRKAVFSGSSSCPPIGRVKSTKENSMVGDGSSIRPMASSVPCQKGKKIYREHKNVVSMIC